MISHHVVGVLWHVSSDLLRQVSCLLCGLWVLLRLRTAWHAGSSLLLLLLLSLLRLLIDGTTGMLLLL